MDINAKLKRKWVMMFQSNKIGYVALILALVIMGSFGAARKQANTVELLTIPASQTVIISGPIMSDPTGLVNAIHTIATSGKTVYILIDSPGGSAEIGVVIIAAMLATKSTVVTVCLSTCASMAAIIHQYGTKRLMIFGSSLMFHDAQVKLEGYITHVQAKLKVSIELLNMLYTPIAVKAGMPLATLLTKLPGELWLNSQEAQLQSFSDGTVSLYIKGEE
jgi:ATP-dependent protease ClpP protease subunit